MDPVTVSVTIDRAPQEVFDHLVVLANHEAFCDHFLRDWTLSGAESGVGARARVRAATPGPADWIDVEIVEVEAPTRIVERTVGAKGRRRTRGTWTLRTAGEGATTVTFTIVTESAPLAERLLAPLSRSWLRRGNQRALERLRDRLAPGGH